MKIIFFGSSDFSLPALETCRVKPHELLLVVTTPDRKKGRGLKLTPNPVSAYCREHSIPLETPESPKTSPVIEKLRSLAPDLLVVSSYGKMIPAEWLTIAKKANLNVHPSLLPKYRGAAPIQWPILNGDSETGITIMEVIERLDAGDIYAQEIYPLDQHIQATELSRDLAEHSRKLLLQVFEQLQNHTASKRPQDEKIATYARKLCKEDGRLDWNKSAQVLHNQIRGLVPWPTAFFEYGGEHVQVLSAKILNRAGAACPPGTLLGKETDCLDIQTGEGVLALLTVKPQGKKEMTAADYARGRHLEKDMRL